MSSTRTRRCRARTVYNQCASSGPTYDDQSARGLFVSASSGAVGHRQVLKFADL